jgi:hypothetical protein
MTEYRDVVLRSGASGGARCDVTVVRARLLGVPVEWAGDDFAEGGTVAFYEEEGGGIIVYEEEWVQTVGLWTIYRWWRAASLDELRSNRFYRDLLERAGL